MLLITGAAIVYYGSLSIFMNMTSLIFWKFISTRIAVEHESDRSGKYHTKVLCVYKVICIKMIVNLMFYLLFMNCVCFRKGDCYTELYYLDTLLHWLLKIVLYNLSLQTFHLFATMFFHTKTTIYSITPFHITRITFLRSINRGMPSARTVFVKLDFSHGAFL